MVIAFNKPDLSKLEGKYVNEVVISGKTSGGGKYTALCEKTLTEQLSVKKCLLTSSCTHALEMSALLVDIQPGDEVIVPSFTFVTSALAFVMRGAIPVFADIRKDTLNIDETQLNNLITDKTRAIVVVHYAGVACEMDTIMAIAERHHLFVIEDNAHGLFGKYKNQYLGSIGHLATLSFHETKNLSCGEGGALLINDERFIKRAEILRDKGTDRARFFRGEIDKYSWVDLGSSYLMSELNAAMLLGQLERAHDIQSHRARVWNEYYRHLMPLINDSYALPTIPVHCEQTYHMFYLLCRDEDQRQDLIQFMKNKGVQVAFHYLPLHTSSAGKQYLNKLQDCPVTNDIAHRLVRLPLYRLPLEDLNWIKSCLTEYLIR
ncbi:MAG: dTDP-4-amino-4,6-dideoxygalactose transaminase [Aestuariibacter sp.]